MTPLTFHDDRSVERTTLRVAPNAVLDHDRLLIDGQRAWLSHRDDLAIVALTTVAVVAPLLDSLFAGITGRPTPDGQVVPCGLSVGEQYTQHALMLYHAEDSRKREDAGRALLRWCLLAHLLVDMTAHPCFRTPAFGAIRLLLEQGACVLRVDATDLDGEILASERGLGREDRVGTMRMGGVAKRTDQGSPEVLTVPWVGDLGVDLESDLLGLVCQVMGDLHVTGKTVQLDVGVHRMLAYPDLGPSFRRAFDQVPDEQNDGTGDCQRVVRMTHSRGTTVFRSHRARLIDGDHLYAFRRLRSDPPRLFAEAPITPKQIDALCTALEATLGPVDGPALAARQRTSAPEMADLAFWVDNLVEQILDAHDGARAGAFRARARQTFEAMGQTLPDSF